MAASKAKPGGLNYGMPGPRHHPASGDGRAVADHQGRVQPRAVPRDRPKSIQMTLGGQIDFAVAPLTAAASSGLLMPGLFAEKRNPVDPRRADREGAGLRRRAAEHRRTVRPAGLPPTSRRKLDDACMTAMQSEPFQRIVKTHVPAGRLLRRQRGLRRQPGQGRGGQAAAADRARHGEELAAPAPWLSSRMLLRIMSM